MTETEEEATKVTLLVGRLFETIDNFHDETENGLRVCTVLNALFSAMVTTAMNSPRFNADQFRDDMVDMIQSLKALPIKDERHGHA